MLRVEDLKNINETEKNKKLYVESYNKCFYPEGVSKYSFIKGVFDKVKFEKSVREGSCNALFMINKFDFLINYAKLKVLRELKEEIKGINENPLLILHIPNSLVNLVNQTILSLTNVEQNILEEYFEKDSEKEVNVLIMDNFIQRLFKNLSHEDFYKLIDYNLTIMYENLKNINEYGFGIYKKTNFVSIKDETFTDVKEALRNFTFVESVPVKDLADFLQLKGESKNLHFLMQEMEMLLLKRNRILFPQSLVITDLLGVFGKNIMFNLLKILEIVTGDFLGYCDLHQKGYLVLQSIRNEEAYDKESFLKKIVDLNSFSHSSLEMSDFEYLGEELHKINSLVAEKNHNILIWGAPGNGKTDFVKMLASNNKKRMLDHYLYNKNRGSLDVMMALSASKMLSKSLSDCWLLVDEAESILRDEKNKIIINNELNEAENTIFWIVNSLDGIDSSVLRRFSYIMEFNQVSFSKREEIASNMLGDKNENGLSLKLAQALKTPSEIISAIQWCQETKDFSWKNVITKMVNYQNAISYSSIEKNGGFEIKVVLPKENDGLKQYAGYRYIKDEVIKKLDILRNPDKFKKLNAKIPKGLLLMGSAGVGKTLLAQKIANEYQMSIVTAKATSLAEDPVRIKYLFDKAKSIAPCIVLLDELDVLGSNVVSITGEIDTNKQKILNSLLVEMDGFEKFDGILVIGSTHRSYLLDPALLRSGRFGEKLLLRKPESKDREEIIQYYMKDKAQKDLDFKAAAKLTSGMSSADLSEIVNISAIKASEKNLDAISQKELLEAIDEIFFGVKTDGLPFSLKDKWRVAIHEGGHALIAMKNGVEIQRATISPHLNFLGMVELHHEEEKQCYGEKEILAKVEICLAGMIAEKAILGSFATGNSGDLRQANIMIRNWLFYNGGGNTLGLGGFNAFENSNEMKYALEKEINKILNEARIRVETWVKENQEKLVDFAKMLISARSLDYDEIKVWCETNKIMVKVENHEESIDDMIQMAYSANYLSNTNSQSMKTSQNE